MHRTTAGFRTCLARLPEVLRRVARQDFDLLKHSRAHPSLHFKKVGKQWSVKVEPNLRALAVEDGADLVRRTALAEAHRRGVGPVPRR